MCTGMSCIGLWIESLVPSKNQEQKNEEYYNVVAQFIGEISEDSQGVDYRKD